MITSIKNERIKEWKKLHCKKYRFEMQKFLIEGFHLIEEAFESDWTIESIIVLENVQAPDWMQEDAVFVVSNQVFQELSQTETPQGIIAVVQMKKLEPQHDRYVLLVDAVQDPGNLGTMIRTADAAGFSKVILGKGTVDVYNDKVIRATQGSIFHIPVEQVELAEAIAQLKSNAYTIWASTLTRATNYKQITSEGNVALIVGNEGAGIQEAYIELADELVKIPIYGKAESLNVSIAAGILMYHIQDY